MDKYIKRGQMLNFYSYIYRDPITNIPRYVGKGFGNRAYIHTKNRCDNKQLKGWIQNLKKQTYQPIIEIIAALDEGHACFIEECLIEVFGRLDMKTGSLFNHTNGGEGITGYKHTGESKEKISRASKNRIFAPMSKEQKQKLSIINTGKKLSAETCMKMSIARKGMKKPWQSNRPRTEKESINLNSMTEKIKLKVEIFGVEYSSIRSAAKTIGVHEETTRYRCHSPRFPDYKILEVQNG